MRYSPLATRALPAIVLVRTVFWFWYHVTSLPRSPDGLWFGMPAEASDCIANTARMFSQPPGESPRQPSQRISPVGESLSWPLMISKSDSASQRPSSLAAAVASAATSALALSVPQVDSASSYAASSSCPSVATDSFTASSFARPSAGGPSTAHAANMRLRETEKLRATKVRRCMCVPEKSYAAPRNAGVRRGA
jgi:hypothetical protein